MTKQETLPKGVVGAKCGFAKILSNRGVKMFFTHLPCRTSGWKKLLALMTLSLTLKDRSYMYLNHIDKHLLFFSLKIMCILNCVGSLS